jgi:hypothetical protein
VTSTPEATFDRSVWNWRHRALELGGRCMPVSSPGLVMQRPGPAFLARELFQLGERHKCNFLAEFAHVLCRVEEAVELA